MPVGVGPPMHNMSSQPHSLPIYPLQWGVPRAYMDPGAQLDISQSIWRVAPGPYPSPGAGREERSRSRDRSRAGGEDQRRRAQSKSPARRGQGNGPSARYMDSVPNLAPDMSGLGRMFREFGAGMKAKMSRPKTPLPTTSHDTVDPGPSPTKSNLKKREEEKATAQSRL